MMSKVSPEALAMNRIPICALAFALQYVGPAKSADLTLNNVNVGETLYGPKISQSQLAGAVVLVEHWGIR